MSIGLYCAGLGFSDDGETFGRHSVLSRATQCRTPRLAHNTCSRSQTVSCPHFLPVQKSYKLFAVMKESNWKEFKRPWTAREDNPGLRPVRMTLGIILEDSVSKSTLHTSDNAMASQWRM
jgi:hypothetical protein